MPVYEYATIQLEARSGPTGQVIYRVHRVDGPLDAVKRDDLFDSEVALLNLVGAGGWRRMSNGPGGQGRRSRGSP